MPASQLLLSNTECLQLGAAIGEYMSADLDARFLPILRWRTHDFVPDFDFMRITTIHPEFPGDVHWVGVDGQSEVGVSPSHPRKVFGRAIDDQFATLCSWNPGRRSLIDLICVHLRSLLNLSFSERLICELIASGGMEERWLEIVDRFRQTPHVIAKMCRPTHDEFKSDVAAAVEKLAVDNNSVEVYQLGYLFGVCDKVLENYADGLRPIFMSSEPPELLADAWFDVQAYCTDLESDEDLSEMEDEPVFHRHIDEELDALIRHPLVRRSPFSTSLLMSCKGLFREETIGKWLEEMQMGEGRPVDEYYAEVRVRQRNLWLAIGDVMGMLRDSDGELQVKHSRQFSQRMWEWETASRSSLQSKLKKAWADLEDPRVGPDDLIRHLIWGVEPTVKRVWAREVDQMNLNRVLSDKIHSPDQLERRFASIALTLRQVYRNDPYHDEFCCKDTEARFVVAAITALVELGNQLEDRRMAAKNGSGSAS